MDVSSIIIHEFTLICGSMVKSVPYRLCITDDIPILFQYKETKIPSSLYFHTSPATKTIVSLNPLNSGTEYRPYRHQRSAHYSQLQDTKRTKLWHLTPDTTSNEIWRNHRWSHKAMMEEAFLKHCNVLSIMHCVIIHKIVNLVRDLKNKVNKRTL